MLYDQRCFVDFCSKKTFRAWRLTDEIAVKYLSKASIQYATKSERFRICSCFCAWRSAVALAELAATVKRRHSSSGSTTVSLSFVSRLCDTLDAHQVRIMFSRWSATAARGAADWRIVNSSLVARERARLFAASAAQWVVSCQKFITCQAFHTWFRHVVHIYRKGLVVLRLSTSLQHRFSCTGLGMVVFHLWRSNASAAVVLRAQALQFSIAFLRTVMTAWSYSARARRCATEDDRRNTMLKAIMVWRWGTSNVKLCGHILELQACTHRTSAALQVGMLPRILAEVEGFQTRLVFRVWHADSLMVKSNRKATNSELPPMPDLPRLRKALSQAQTLLTKPRTSPENENHSFLCPGSDTLIFVSFFCAWRLCHLVGRLRRQNGCTFGKTKPLAGRLRRTGLLYEALKFWHLCCHLQSKHHAAFQEKRSGNQPVHAEENVLALQETHALNRPKSGHAEAQFGCAGDQSECAGSQSGRPEESGYVSQEAHAAKQVALTEENMVVSQEAQVRRPTLCKEADILFIASPSRRGASRRGHCPSDNACRSIDAQFATDVVVRSQACTLGQFSQSVIEVGERSPSKPSALAATWNSQHIPPTVMKVETDTSLQRVACTATRSIAPSALWSRCQGLQAICRAQEDQIRELERAHESLNWRDVL